MDFMMKKDSSPKFVLDSYAIAMIPLLKPHEEEPDTFVASLRSIEDNMKNMEKNNVKTVHAELEKVNKAPEASGRNTLLKIKPIIPGLNIQQSRQGLGQGIKSGLVSPSVSRAFSDAFEAEADHSTNTKKSIVVDEEGFQTVSYRDKVNKNAGNGTLLS